MTFSRYGIRWVQSKYVVVMYDLTWSYILYLDKFSVELLWSCGSFDDKLTLLIETIIFGIKNRIKLIFLTNVDET